MQQTATVQVTSTASLPVADCFPYWADVVTQTLVPLECDTPVRRDFFGSIRSRQIGRIAIADVYGSPQRVRRTRAKIMHGPSDDLIVVVHIEGRCKAGRSENAAQLQPGDGVIVSAEHLYFFDFPDCFRQLVLKVPRALLRSAVEETTGTFRLTCGPANLLRHLAFATLDETDLLSGTGEIGIERALAELLRSALAPAASGNLTDRAALTRHAAACDFIRRNLPDPALDPAAVATHVGVSVRSLSRLFAVRGESVERTIWSLRLAAAKDDLADPRLKDSSITDVAFSWGFNDAAHFSRSFAHAYGITPSGFRAKTNDP